MAVISQDRLHYIIQSSKGMIPNCAREYLKGLGGPFSKDSELLLPRFDRLATWSDSISQI